MNTNKETIDRQLLELSKEYLGKVEGYAKDYQKAIHCLDDARKSYEKSWWRNGLEVLKVAAPFLTVLLIYFLMQSQPCGTTIKSAGVEFVKSCPTK